MTSSLLDHHVTRTLPGGGLVLVLNTNATIGPEAQAMLGALHSRSIGGVKSHLTHLKERGAEKFMSTYYVGYGHKSIGDIGSASVFIEGISMLAAKAIQDWPLYNGQESSTRYIDFHTQPFINPLGTKEGEHILEAWRSFYLAALEELVPVLRKRFPIQGGEKETVYEKAIRARALDTLRSFLPAGAATNVVWHGTLRQFADKLLILRHHPLDEVKTIADAIEEALTEAFPSSFAADKKRYDATEAYQRLAAEEVTYFDDPDTPVCALTRDAIDRTLLRRYQNILQARPAKTELPNILAECGVVQYSYRLDFGSFRDIQRHRAVCQHMPLLTTAYGFHPWYLDELPEGLRADAQALISAQKERIASLPAIPTLRQYYTPMGYLTTNRLTGTLPAVVYLIELRATRFVHPTLRALAQQMGVLLLGILSSTGLTLHIDNDPDRFDVRRGEHDIVTRT